MKDITITFTLTPELAQALAQAARGLNYERSRAIAVSAGNESDLWFIMMAADVLANALAFRGYRGR